MGAMKKFLRRLRTVLKSAPAVFVAASTIITIFSEEMASVLPTSAGEAVARVTLVVLAWLGAAANIVRRVTPVIPEQFGLDPVEGPVIAAANAKAGRPYGDLTY